MNDEDDACHAQGSRQCDPGSLCGRREQGQAQDPGGVHRGDRVSREVRDPCPEQPPGSRRSGRPVNARRSMMRPLGVL